MNKISMDSFRFTVDKWLFGNIQSEPDALKGLFIDICALIWKHQGFLKIETLMDLKGRDNVMKLWGKYIYECKGYVCVHFIQEQVDDYVKMCHRNRANRVSKLAKNACEKY